MKRLFLICLAAVIYTASVAGQNSISFQLKEFSTLRVAGNMHVEVKPLPEGQTPYMTVNLNGGDAKSFAWNQRSGRLSIKMNYPAKGHKAVATVYCNDIATVIADGADMTAEFMPECKTLDIVAKKESRLSMDIDGCKDLRVSVSGKSVAVISGKCTYAASRTKEKSVLDTRLLDARSMEAVSRTKSEIYVGASDRIIIDAAQNSKVFYKGAPDILRTKAVSGSAVNSIGE